MKKMILSVLCLALLAAVLAGCGAQKAPEVPEVPAAAGNSPIAGGWAINEGDVGMEANPEAKAALEKALEGLTGAGYEPLACLGTQLVAGTNYCILCRITPVAPNAASHFGLVYVYQALDGTAKLLDVQDLTFGVQAKD